MGLNLAVSVEEFFDSDRLGQNLAFHLGIDSSKIRVVNVVRETITKRKRRQEMQQLRVDFEIGNPPTAAVTMEQSSLSFQQLEDLTEMIVDVIQTGQLTSDLNATIVNAVVMEPEPKREDPTNGIRATPETGGPQPGNETVGLETFYEMQLELEQENENETEPLVFTIPTRLSVEEIGMTGMEGMPLAQQPIIAMFDNLDSIISNLGLEEAWQVRATIQQGPQAGFLTNNTASLINGRAQFSELTFSYPGTYYILFETVFPDTADFSVAAQPITILPRNLTIEIVTQPGEGNTTFPLYPYPTVEVRDDGMVLSDHDWRNSTWFVRATLQRSSETENETESLETWEVELNSGVAQFTELEFTDPGRYTLLVSVVTHPPSSHVPPTITTQEFIVFQHPYTILELIFDEDYDTVIGSDGECLEEFKESFLEVFLETYPSPFVEIYNVTVSERRFTVSVFLTANRTEHLQNHVEMVTTSNETLTFSFGGLDLSPAFILTIPTRLSVERELEMSGIEGRSLAQQPTFAMLDDLGLIINNLGLEQTWQVRATIQQGPQGGFLTNNTASLINGRAQFSELTFSYPGTYYILFETVFPDTADFSVAAQPITILPRNLTIEIVTQPGEGNTTFPLYPYPTVEVRDDGMVLSDHDWRNSTWFVRATLQRSSETENETESLETWEVELNSGVAQFTELEFTDPGRYTLLVSVVTHPPSSHVPPTITTQEFIIIQNPYTILELIFDEDYNTVIGSDEERLEEFKESFLEVFLETFPSPFVEIYNVTVSERRFTVSVFLTANRTEHLQNHVEMVTTSNETLTFSFGGLDLSPAFILTIPTRLSVERELGMTGIEGKPLAQHPIFAMLDDLGLIINNLGLEQTWQVRATIQQGPQGGFLTNNTASLINGRAQFSELTFSYPGTYYILFETVFPDTADFSVAAQPITILPRNLTIEIVTQPGEGNTTFPLYPYPTVEVRDDGMVLSDHDWRNSTWFVRATLQRSSETENETESLETWEVELNSGVAQFTELEFTDPGRYTLLVSVVTHPPSSHVPPTITTQEFIVIQNPYTILKLIFDEDYNAVIGSDEERLEEFKESFLEVFLETYPSPFVEIYNVTVSERRFTVSVFLTANRTEHLQNHVEMVTTSNETLTFSFGGLDLSPAFILTIPTRLSVERELGMTGIEGRPLAQHPIIAMLDDLGLIINNLGLEQTWQVRATIQQGPQGGFLTNNTASLINGRAQFSELTFSYPGTYYILFETVFPDTADFSVAAQPITILPRNLTIEIVTQPGEGNTTFPLYPYPTVEVRDDGMVLSDHDWRNSTWFVRATLQRNSETENETESLETWEVELNSGVAQFTELEFTDPGRYTLLVSVVTHPPSSHVPPTITTQEFIIIQNPYTILKLIFDEDYNAVIGSDEERLEEFKESFLEVFLETYPSPFVEIYNVTVSERRFTVSVFLTANRTEHLQNHVEMVTTSNETLTFSFGGLDLSPAFILTIPTRLSVERELGMTGIEGKPLAQHPIFAMLDDLGLIINNLGLEQTWQVRATIQQGPQGGFLTNNTASLINGRAQFSELTFSYPGTYYILFETVFPDTADFSVAAQPITILPRNLTIEIVTQPGEGNTTFPLYPYPTVEVRDDGMVLSDHDWRNSTWFVRATLQRSSETENETESLETWEVELNSGVAQFTELEFTDPGRYTLLVSVVTHPPSSHVPPTITTQEFIVIQNPYTILKLIFDEDYNAVIGSDEERLEEFKESFLEVFLETYPSPFVEIYNVTVSERRFTVSVFLTANRTEHLQNHVEMVTTSNETLTFSFGGLDLSPAFILTIPTRLSVERELGMTGIEGRPLAQHPIIAMLDDLGLIINNLGLEQTWQVRATIQQGPQGGFLTNNTASLINGRAQFSELTFSYPGTYYILFETVFPDTADFSVAAQPITILPRNLTIEIVTQPGEGNTTFPLYPYPTVEVRDDGMVLSDHDWRNSTWFVRATLQRNSETENETESLETWEVELTSGVAQFKELEFTDPGRYTLLVSVVTHPPSSHVPPTKTSQGFIVTQNPFTRLELIFDEAYDTVIGPDGERLEEFKESFIQAFFEAFSSPIIESYNVTISRGSIIVSIFLTTKRPQDLQRYVNMVTSSPNGTLSFDFQGIELSPSSIEMDPSYPIDIPEDSEDELTLILMSIIPAGSLLLLILIIILVATICYRRQRNTKTFKVYILCAHTHKLLFI